MNTADPIDIEKVLLHLRSLDVKLWVEGDRLRYSAPRGVLTPALRAELVERKAEILAFLREAETAARTPSPPMRPVSRAGELPLSFAQQRMWFLDQVEGGSATYNIPMAWEITGPLHVDALEQSLREIVRRHQALRTTFPVVNGAPVQAIASTPTVTLSVIDLAGAEQTAEVRRLTAQEAQRPFDLAKGPLLRATLLRLGTEPYTSAVLLVTMHHIVSDVWSMGILTREMSTLYEAFSSGRPSPLPELPIQYADFAHWQRQWLSGDVLKTQLNYWKRQLAGAPPTAELPTDRARPSAQTFRGSTQRFRLNPNLVHKLKALSQQSGATLFMTLLAAFVTLLSRYSNQEDIVVGSPIANRNRSEIEPLIGLFVNTLALRVDLSGSPTFQELLSRVREVALAAYDHQDIPFERLVEALEPGRSLSHAPLFQVMFVLHNVPMPALELPGLIVRPIEVETRTAKFDLRLSLEGDGCQGEEGLVGAWQYSTDLFEAGTIARMTGHFLTLLEGIVADPSQRLSELPLLTAAERHQLLVEWNNTKADYPRDKCIHQLFEAQVERTPNAVAAATPDAAASGGTAAPENKSLTYQELNTRANQLAHYLQSLGVGPGVLVGICVERSLEMIVGVLGILKAGGAYVPLEPVGPKERLALALKHAQVQVLLTQSKLLTRLPGHSARIVRLDTDWDAISRKSKRNPASGVKPDHIAYVMYTTGSTGKPKGVIVEHRQLLNYSLGILERLRLTPGASFAMVQPLTVDSCITVIFPSLCTGGVLHVIPRDQALDPLALADYFRCHPIDCLKIAPSHLAALQSLPQPKQFIPRQRLVIGGEPSRWEWVKQLQSMAGDCQVFNHYGPTETTVGVLTHQVERGPTKYDCSITPLGRPLANTRIYVLDSHLQPVPIGVLGELHIGGANVARGYLNRPDLTAAKFIPDPFSDEPGARLYKTGDLARYLPDGSVEFLGRSDHQVKIRGFRVEPGEIEAVLGQHPAIREVIVVAQDAEARRQSRFLKQHNREASPWEKYLVAYFIPTRQTAPTLDELRGFLKERLPDYMIPSAFVRLETFPRTPHGKLDRRALPAPDTSRPELKETYVSPRDPVEELLANIWAQVLGLEKVGIYDDFFELGGHSLLATQLIFRVRETFQIELPLRKFFENATIVGLAQAIGVVQRLGSEATVTETTVPDLGAEAILDPAIHPSTISKAALGTGPETARVIEPTAVFLTGATGFIGAFLLRELLQQTQADVYCLVRAADAEAGRQKIQGNLESYLLWQPGFGSRITPIVGDLAQPYLGLPTQQFQTLARQIDAIYHCGAMVNFVYPYDKLKPVNVLGTQEVLRLATQAQAIIVHYISTLSVFSALSYHPRDDNGRNDRSIREEAELSHSQNLRGGYAQSKWVAEKLVAEARTRGLPVCIYRLGTVAGDSQTGVWNANDYVCRFIRGCIQLGSIPDQDEAWHLAPVDYVSEAIVHLSRQPTSPGKTFHVFSPYCLHTSQLADWIRAFGYELRQLSHKQWLTELIRVAKHSPEHALYPLLPSLMERVRPELRSTDGRRASTAEKEPRFDRQNLLDGLTGTAIVCPPIDAKLLAAYLSYFVRTGSLDAPPPGGKLEHIET